MKTDSKEASCDASYEAPLTRKIGLQKTKIWHSNEDAPFKFWKKSWNEQKLIFQFQWVEIIFMIKKMLVWCWIFCTWRQTSCTVWIFHWKTFVCPPEHDQDVFSTLRTQWGSKGCMNLDEITHCFLWWYAAHHFWTKFVKVGLYNILKSLLTP